MQSGKLGQHLETGGTDIFVVSEDSCPPLWCHFATAFTSAVHASVYNGVSVKEKPVLMGTGASVLLEYS